MNTRRCENILRPVEPRGKLEQGVGKVLEQTEKFRFVLKQGDLCEIKGEENRLRRMPAQGDVCL